MMCVEGTGLGTSFKPTSLHSPMFPQLPSLVSLSYNFFKNRAFQSSSVAQQVKDLVMLLQQLRPLLQLGFGPWTGDFCMLWK